MSRLAPLAALFALLLPPLAAQNEPDVPYVPTPQAVVDSMLKLAALQPSDTLYDLGCGDGRIVITAARSFSAKATGIDINPERIREAVDNAAKAGVADRVKFLEKNLFDADFREATVVTLYLLPDVNLRLRPRLLQQLKDGARIVSHSFDMGDWKPDRETDASGRTLYLWTVTPQAREKFGKESGDPNNP